MFPDYLSISYDYVVINILTFFYCSNLVIKEIYSCATIAQANL